MWQQSKEETSRDLRDGDGGMVAGVSLRFSETADVLGLIFFFLSYSGA